MPPKKRKEKNVDDEDEEIEVTFTLVVPYTTNKDYMLKELKEVENIIDVEIAESLVAG